MVVVVAAVIEVVIAATAVVVVVVVVVVAAAADVVVGVVGVVVVVVGVAVMIVIVLVVVVYRFLFPNGHGCCLGGIGTWCALTARTRRIRSSNRQHKAHGCCSQKTFRPTAGALRSS